MAKALTLASLLAVFVPYAAAADSRAPDQLTLVVVGDVGLNRNQLPVDPKGVVEGKGVYPWAEMSAEIKDLIDGDLNFMNLETVVTDRNDLSPGNKGQKSPYLFRTHPKGVAHLCKLCFNLVTSANNHAYDYGEQGVVETVKHLEAARRSGMLRYAGIGNTREAASKPVRMKRKWAKVAFSAIGIVTNMLKHHRATDKKPGTLGYRTEEDWKHAVNRLHDETEGAQLRLLSIHYGVERDIRTDERQKRDYRWAVGERGVDVLIGHHAHVVRGVELHKGRLLFYGLGNSLIRGARDMGTSAALHGCCDYGLLSRVHLAKGKDQHYSVAAIEAIPVIDMHRRPRPFPDKEQSKTRIEVLNVLAESLDDSAAQSVGVRFMVREDGTGLYCAKDAATLGGNIGALCKDYQPAGEPSQLARKYVSRAPSPSLKSKRKWAADKVKRKRAGKGKHKRKGKRRRR